jgi:hypothetical protein
MEMEMIAAQSNAECLGKEESLTHPFGFLISDTPSQRTALNFANNLLRRRVPSACLFPPASTEASNFPTAHILRPHQTQSAPSAIAMLCSSPA